MTEPRYQRRTLAWHGLVALLSTGAAAWALAEPQRVGPWLGLLLGGVTNGLIALEKWLLLERKGE